MAITVRGDMIVSGETGVVVVEGADAGEVNGATAKALALQVARRHLPRPGHSSQSGPYAVDPDTDQAYADADLLRGIKPGSPWRQEFTMRGGF